MKKLLMLLLWGGALLCCVAPLAAQNAVDILNNGPQPPNTTGCAMNPNCLPATWSTTSNGGADITNSISANFVFVPNSGHLASDFPADTTGNICLADTRDFSPVVFGQISANCQASGGIALLIIYDGATNAPATIPVFSISTASGDFLKNTVGYGPAPNNLSNYPIRIDAVPAISGGGPTGQHNCAGNQGNQPYVGPGTANYTPNESLCLPAAAGQAVEPSMIVDSQGSIYVESIRGVPGGLDAWRYYKAADGGPNSDGTLPFKYEGQPDCGIFVTTFCMQSGLAPGGGDGDLAVNAPDPSNKNIPNLAVVSLAAAEVTGSQTTNRADTFSTPNPATAGVPFDDRMWIDAFDDPSHVYMEYHDFGTGSQIFVQRSNNGGQTYTDAAGVALDAATEPSAGPPTGNIAGQIKVDHSATGSHGNVYQIFVGPDNPTDNANNSSTFLNAVYVGVASNVSLSNPALTFTDYKIFSCGAGSTCPTGLGLGNLFPALAVDNFGYVYAAWSDNTNVYYSYSTTHGTSWSPAINITQGTTQAGMSNLFTWMTADANGHVAIAWYGADMAGNSNTISANWNVFVAETVNGHAKTPVFTLSKATDHVNHTGSISTGGLTGSSDRSLADFFQIAMDPNHLVNIAFADNHAGKSVTYFTREKTAAKGIQPCGNSADADGDENGHKGGKASFH
ncbi:MAG: PA domain-containing protein, partial [Terriglobales bacterium]